MRQPTRPVPLVFRIRRSKNVQAGIGWRVESRKAHQHSTYNIADFAAIYPGDTDSMARWNRVFTPYFGIFIMRAKGDRYWHIVNILRFVDEPLCLFDHRRTQHIRTHRHLEYNA